MYLSFYVIVVVVIVILVLAYYVLYQPKLNSLQTPSHIQEQIFKQFNKVATAFTVSQNPDGTFNNYSVDEASPGGFKLEKSQWPVNFDGLPVNNLDNHGTVYNVDTTGFAVSGVVARFTCPTLWYWSEDDQSCLPEPICPPHPEAVIRGINSYQFHSLPTNSDVQIHELRDDKATDSPDLIFHSRIYAVCAPGEQPPTHKQAKLMAQQGLSIDFDDPLDSLNNMFLESCEENTKFNQMAVQPIDSNPCIIYDVCTENFENYIHRLAPNADAPPLADNEFYICQYRTSVRQSCPINQAFDVLQNTCLPVSRCLNKTDGSTLPSEFVDRQSNEYVLCQGGREFIRNCPFGTHQKQIDPIDDQPATVEWSCVNPNCLDRIVDRFDSEILELPTKYQLCENNTITNVDCTTEDIVNDDIVLFMNLPFVNKTTFNDQALAYPKIFADYSKDDSTASKVSPHPHKRTSRLPFQSQVLCVDFNRELLVSRPELLRENGHFSTSFSPFVTGVTWSYVNMMPAILPELNYNVVRLRTEYMFLDEDDQTQDLLYVKKSIPNTWLPLTFSHGFQLDYLDLNEVVFASAVVIDAKDTHYTHMTFAINNLILGKQQRIYRERARTSAKNSFLTNESFIALSHYMVAAFDAGDAIRCVVLRHKQLIIFDVDKSSAIVRDINDWVELKSFAEFLAAAPERQLLIIPDDPGQTDNLVLTNMVYRPLPKRAYFETSDYSYVRTGTTTFYLAAINWYGCTRPTYHERLIFNYNLTTDDSQASDLLKRSTAIVAAFQFDDDGNLYDFLNQSDILEALKTTPISTMFDLDSNDVLLNFIYDMDLPYVSNVVTVKAFDEAVAAAKDAKQTSSADIERIKKISLNTTL